MERALNKALTPAKADALVRKLISCALAGEPWAVKELLDRCLGKSRETLDITGTFTVSEFFRVLRSPALLTG